ncbi:hypothetical protein TSUD_85350 [Trifolium subterraneum]|uniref:F-box domain-containing protein n=1 Tax=Trifolium subterraneum TaxID=3900 RepID=A0A2Z6PCY6_TRISU|nr:hypothetical protein TSUD_85350 [Trifolium subterraneum]
MSKSIDEVIMIPPDKRARHDVNEENQDRLSHLPDSVLLNILSFFNSKHAVQTCVLSTRWKYLWKRIHTLILHSTDFSTVKKFAIFVSKILTLRDTTSTALLDLHHCGDIEPQLLQNILNYISSHNTHFQELRISLDTRLITSWDSSCRAQALTSLGDTRGLIMSCVSSCRALTSLKLSLYPPPFYHRCSDNCTQTFPKSLNLPSLTSLDLTNFTFCGGENGCAEPFSAFTKLNSLVIRSCMVKDAQILRISTKTLVNLSMYYYSSNFAKVELSTPSLCTFTFPKSTNQKICGSGLSSVKQVYINAQEDAVSVEHALVLLSWLQDLANVESLTVTSITLQILYLVPDLFKVKFSSLCNMTSLKVELIPFAYGGGLPRLIEKEMLKKAAAKSRQEAAKLRNEFKAGRYLETTRDLSVVEESIKAGKNANYHSQFATPAASSAVPASATPPASTAPPNLHLCHTEKVEESIKGGKNTSYHSQFATPAASSAVPASAAESASATTPVSTAPPNLHLCHTEKMTTNIDNNDSTLWPDLVTKAFIDIMVDEVTKGNMPNGVFYTGTWTSMTTRLNSITNRSYEKEQLKAKFHRLRAMFVEFYSLLQNTGFRWNAETNTVTASEEVWQNYLKAHGKASQFQKKGCDHYKLLEIIFNRKNETEVLHHSSIQDQPNTNIENELNNQYLNTESTNNACVDNDSSDNDIQVECIIRSGKQEIQVKYHTSRTESTSHQMGDAARGSSSHVTEDCSLTRCVVALEEIRDISDDIFGKALEKFKDPDWREMFIAMSNDRRRGWLLRL